MYVLLFLFYSILSFSCLLFPFWTCFNLMMRFDTIVSFHVRHDVICFKLGKWLDVWKWQSNSLDGVGKLAIKNLTSLNLSETILSILIYNIPISHHDEILDKFILVLTILSNLFLFLLAFPTIFFTFFHFFHSFFTFWICFDLSLTIMMQFDTIVSFLVRHDVICLKLGKCHRLCLTKVTK